MGTLLLSVCCSLALNAQSLEIKNDTIHKYMIDKQVIERFDGTQLEGKTISKYIIAYKKVGSVVEKNHVIFTENKQASSEAQSVGPVKFAGLIMVDGKEKSIEELNQLKADEIASMNIYKADSKVAKSYGEKGKKGVLMISTKQDSGNVYFVDGKRVEKSVVDKLSPDKIASMVINKKEGNSVIDIVLKK